MLNHLCKLFSSLGFAILQLASDFKMGFDNIHGYMYTLTGSLGFIANVIQIIVTCRDKNRRNNVFGLAVLSLSIADALTSIVGIFTGVIIFLINSDTIDSISERVGYFMTAAAKFSLTSSFTHAVFIAVQRVIAVAFPFKVKQLITKSRCYIILALIWTVSAGVAFVIPYFSIYTGLKSLALTCIAAGVILMIMYSVICYKARGRDVVNNTSEEMQRRRQQSDRDLLLYSMAITFVFIFCNFPSSIKTFVKFSTAFEIAGDFLYCLNPFLDTLLYFGWSHWKRRRRRISDNSRSLSEGNSLTARNQEPSVEMKTRF